MKKYIIIIVFLVLTILTLTYFYYQYNKNTDIENISPKNTKIQSISTWSLPSQTQVEINSSKIKIQKTQKTWNFE